MKRILVLTALLAGCSTYQPRVGMTVNQWHENCALSANCGIARQVAMRGDEEVWSDGKGSFAYFRGGRLSHVDQGQLYEQRISVRQN